MPLRRTLTSSRVVVAAEPKGLRLLMSPVSHTSAAFDKWSPCRTHAQRLIGQRSVQLLLAHALARWWWSQRRKRRGVDHSTVGVGVLS